jgi:hypothetical protein
VSKNIARILLALLILLAPAGCAPSPSPTSYLGQKPPGMQPEIFAPGIVSTPGFTEWSGTFSPEGDEYYFWRTSSSQHQFFCTRMIDGKWTTPEELTAIAEYWASEPQLTLDNNRLYFMWKHPAPPGPEGLPSYYFIERTADGWSEPEYAGQGMFLSSSRDGLLYTTDMSLRLITGETYLAKVTTDDGVFVNYERLDIPTYLGSQAHPCIAPDGSYILFDVHGGYYLFVCFKKADGTWGEAIDLSKHGFNPLAGGAYVSPDGKYLFFALNEDIYWVDIKAIEKLRPRE